MLQRGIIFVLFRTVRSFCQSHFNGSNHLFSSWWKCLVLLETDLASTPSILTETLDKTVVKKYLTIFMSLICSSILFKFLRTFGNFFIPFVQNKLDFAQHERLNVKQAVTVVDGIRKSLGGIRSSHQIGKSITYKEVTTTYAYVLRTFFMIWDFLTKLKFN